jgi:hypothetical protein
VAVIFAIVVGVAGCADAAPHTSAAAANALVKNLIQATIDGTDTTPIPRDAQFPPQTSEKKPYFLDPRAQNCRGRLPNPSGNCGGHGE